MDLPGTHWLPHVLDAAIACDPVTCAGNIQLLDTTTGALHIVAQRGFRPAFLEHFAEVRIGEGSACARALAIGHRIIIEDVRADSGYRHHLDIALESGYQAVQSTAILDRTRIPLGILSTHFPRPHRPASAVLHLLDQYARIAGLLIECERLGPATGEMSSDARHALRTLASQVPELARNDRAEIAAVTVALALERFLGMPREATSPARTP